MDAEINKKNNMNSTVLSLVLFVSVLLHSFVSHVHADR